jgi:hypothetical protein
MKINPLLRVQEIEMPIGAEILCIQTQNEKPCIWAKVDENSKNSFKCGSLVYHLFELWPYTT